MRGSPKRQAAVPCSRLTSEPRAKSDFPLLGNIPLSQWPDLARTAHYNANELADLLGVSTRQLQRVSRVYLGRSPQEWLNEQRILTASKRLLFGNQRVKEVALDLGFKQVSHFCRQFKLRNHVTPSEYARHKLTSACVAHG